MLAHSAAVYRPAVVAGIEEVPNQGDNVWAMVVNDPLQLVVQRFALMEIGCGENRDNCRHRRILVLQVGTAMNQKGECLLSSTECLRPSSLVAATQQQHVHRLKHCPVQPESRSPGKNEEVARYIWLRKKHFPTTAPTTIPIGKFSLFCYAGKAISSRAGIIRLRSVVFGYNVPVRNI